MSLRHIVRRLLASVLAVGMTSCPFVAHACSWARQSEASVIDRFCEADAVFVGEAESTLNIREQISETKLWPRKILKGRVGSPSYALDARIDARPGKVCDFRFQRTGTYLIFADRYEDTDYLCVSTCDLSQRFDEDSFAYRVILSTDNIDEECSEDATRRRRAELRDRHRENWVRELSVHSPAMQELVEKTRHQPETGDATASGP